MDKNSKRITTTIIISAVCFAVIIVIAISAIVWSLLTTKIAAVEAVAESAAQLNAESDRWCDKYQLVAHALGTDGTYPYNCLEGMEWSYENNQRVFECDFAMTSDGRLVLAHSIAGEEATAEDIPDYETFMSTPLEGGYTPMSIEMLLDKMEEYTDMYLITDFKCDESGMSLEQMQLMADVIRQRNQEDLFARIIVQFYDESELASIKGMADFGGYIFTLYKRGFDKTLEDFEEVAAFCQANGVDVVVMKKGKWCSKYADLAKQYGIKVYPHTVYTVWQEELMLRQKADGAYTDGILPADLERLKALPEHWYEKGRDFQLVKSVKAAGILRVFGRRLIKVSDNYESYIDFMVENEDEYMAIDYEEEAFRSFTAAAEEKGAEKIFDRVTVFTDSMRIGTDLMPYVFWCDTVFDARGALEEEIAKGKSAQEALDSLMDDADAKGISVVAMNPEQWDDSFIEVLSNHDDPVYFYGKGIRKDKKR